MSVSPGFREFLIEHMAGFGPVVIKSMFGGAGVMHQGQMFALIVDDVLYFKADATTRPAFVAEGLPQFTYMARGGKRMEMNYWRAPERCMDDADEMANWCRLANAVALKSAAKKKSKRQ